MVPQLFFLLIFREVELLLLFRQSSPEKYDSIFKNYRFIGNFINIKVLDGHIRSEDVNDWAGEIIQLVYIGVQVEKVTLTENHNFKRQNGTKEDCLIGVWDLDILFKFLKVIPFSVIPKPRNRYFFFFLSPETCSKIFEINKLGEHLWIKYGIVEMIAFAPFCTNRVFVYRPFKNCTESYSYGEVSGHLSLLIQRSLQDFCGYPLNVSLFTIAPTAVPFIPRFLQEYSVYRNSYKVTGYMGSDAFFLSTLSEALNFRPVIVSNETGSNYGGILPNGELFGSYRDVAFGKSLFAVNARYLLSYFAESADLTMSHDQLDVCAVVPKALKIAKNPFGLQDFDQMGQILVGLVIAASVSFWYLVNGNFKEALTNTFCFLLGYPRKLPSTVRNFFYIFACFTVTNIILVLILGLMFKHLTTDNYENDIETLDELVKSKLTIVSHYWRYFDIEGDSIWKQLFQKIDLNVDSHDPNLYEIVAYNRNIAVIGSLPSIENIIKQSTLKNNGAPLLHLVSQCITSISQVIIVQKGSPLLDPINSVILSTNEAGLVKKWKHDVNHALFLEKIMNFTQKTTIFQALSLDDFKTSFYLIGIGHFIASLIFLGEILIID